MPSPPAGPLAVDLDVLKLGTTEDPVTLDDVERALYALTGWQKPQRLVDAALGVVVAFAREVRLGTVAPRRSGHGTVACGRAHLDEHVCPVAVKREAVITTCVSCLGVAEPTVDELVDATVATAKLAATTRASLDDAVDEATPPARVRTGVRNTPTMTPLEIVAAKPSDLTPAQLNAYGVLTTGVQLCSACKVTKPLASFYNDKARLTGKASRCKECANAATAARRGGNTPG